MNTRWLFAVLVLLVSTPVAMAGNDWQKFVIPRTGTAVDVPVGLFSADAGPTDDGLGRRFVTGDGRADLTVQAFPNQANDSPAKFLARKQPPSGIAYRRVTPDFFVVSSVRNGKIWYNRCNRSGSYMDCVLINYPAAEKRQWDGIVTRISTTLGRD
jgi:hypothetical protein